MSAAFLNCEIIKNLTAKSNVPIVFRGFVKNWSVCQWTVEKWCAEFGDKEIPFRCLKRDLLSDEPCWERKCRVKNMTFQAFVDSLETSEEWMYFDYKYLHQWFGAATELHKEVSWKEFGYPDKGAADTTLWVGSKGAHTPAHQDTYGYNIVAQLHGKKRWLLFPPETGGLKPTRVPYEESSVYSELNFYCPMNLDVFNDFTAETHLIILAGLLQFYPAGLTGGRMVELAAGDALLVPRGWWHYVQNIDPLNITLNIWLPHDRDCTTRVSEALIKILVAQVCKDLPQDTAKLLVNPNEDDIADTPLAVLFLQLETVANTYLDNRRKARRVKRQKTCEGDPSVVQQEYDLNALLENEANNLEVVPSVTSEEIICLIKSNVREYANTNRSVDEDEVDGSTAGLCLTKAVIDAFSQGNVIELVKQNLYSRLSQSY